MPIGPRRMPFLDHLDEFRRRIMIVAGALFAASAILYVFVNPMLGWLLAPLRPAFGGEVPVLNVLGPFDAFTFRFKVALYAAIVLTSPIWLYNILAFLLPALKPKEQRFFLPTFFAFIVLFLMGNAFAYYIILEPAFVWMFAQGGDFVQVLPEASKFLSGITLLLLGFGIAFEVPIVIFYFVAFGIVPYAKLRKNWRISYVALMIIASVATPDWSPVTMGFLFGALVALYEGSLLLARILLSKRIDAQKAAGN